MLCLQNQWEDLTRLAWLLHWEIDKKWLSFGDLGSLFKDTGNYIKISKCYQKKLFCALSLEPFHRFRWNLVYCITGISERLDYSLVTLTLFQGLWLLNWALSALYLKNQSVNSDQTGMHGYIIDRWGLGSGDLSPIFKVTYGLRMSYLS